MFQNHSTKHPRHSVTVRAAESAHEFIRAIRAEPLIVCMYFTMLVLIIIGIAANVAEGATYYPTDQRCFSKADWGPAPDGIRPCVKLTGNVPTAGAVKFKVSDGDGVVRYTGVVTSPYHHVAAVQIGTIYEDGSFSFVVCNYNDRCKDGAIGNLDDGPKTYDHTLTRCNGQIIGGICVPPVRAIPPYTPGPGKFGH